MSWLSALRGLFAGAPSAITREAIPPRPAFFGLDPFRRNDRPDLRGTPLAALSYVVFDTETTGLRAGRGDAIVAIGAVRVHGANIHRDETFDRLVNPRRRIPAASTRIHGIDDAMVRDAPAIADILPAFRDFVGDAVLVGHNVAFDLNFLALEEQATGIRFDNAVLDTMFLAALLDDAANDHSLDGLARHFGIALESRHSALGDALTTAAIFVRELDVLIARGIVDFGAASDAAQTMPKLKSATARFSAP